MWLFSVALSSRSHELETRRRRKRRSRMKTNGTRARSWLILSTAKLILLLYFTYSNADLSHCASSSSSGNKLTAASNPQDISIWTRGTSSISGIIDHVEPEATTRLRGERQAAGLRREKRSSARKRDRLASYQDSRGEFSQGRFTSPASWSTSIPAMTSFLMGDSQNTTNLLLFTRPDTGLEEDARLNRWTTQRELKQSPFDPSKLTLLLIHGFQGRSLAQQNWALDIKNLVISRQQGGANVLYADWNHLARVFNYLNVLKRISEITEDLRATLINLERAFPSFRKDNVQVIGHSLGAHIAGLLGQSMGGNLSRILALDPAGPMLDEAPPEAKLTLNDAREVVAYHTSAKWLGTEKSLADVDVFFNGGNEQPMCRYNLFASYCAHRASTWYAGVFMGKCRLVAYACQSYEDFASGECGFCPQATGERPVSCVGIGDQWQYEQDQVASSSRQKLRRKSRGSGADFQWTSPEEGAVRYFVATSADEPYCAFAYQVVVKFPEGSEKVESLQSITIGLRNANKMNKTDRARIRLMHRLKPDAKLMVFADKSSRAQGGRNRPSTKLVSGSYVYTGVILVDSKHQSLYNMMPIKFEQIIFETLAIEDLSVGRPEVYVNFMSSPRYEQRAKYSGPIDNMRLGNGVPLNG